MGDGRDRNAEIDLSIVRMPPEVVAHRLEPGAGVPNNPRLALLAYRRAVILPDEDPASVFEALFAANGWPGAWRNGIFGFHHYHSTAHEVLGVYSGAATVRLGGEDGVTMDVGTGDVVIIPAGVAHKLLESTGGFAVVGSYPAGQRPDTCHPGPEPGMDSRVARVTMPVSDPIYGASGAVVSLWQ